jgi:hypothetical protein
VNAVINPDDADAEAALIELGRGLIREHQSKHNPLAVKRERMVNMAHAPLVASLAYHALRLGETVIDLTERGRRLEAFPTVRATFETALTAMWLSQSREATPAFHNEHERQTRNLVENGLKAASEAMRAGAAGITARPSEEYETSANPQARSFESRCASLTGGRDAYVVYRLMSTYAHPSMAITEHYLFESENEAGVTLHSEPTQPTDNFWLYVTVASMIWALRAVDHMDQGHPHRSWLREAAKSLGVAATLNLTAEAKAAEVKAEQERRRASWKGPRRRRTRPGI